MAGLTVNKNRRPWEYPNQPAIDIQANAGPGTPLNVISSASPGQKIYLHELVISFDTSANTGAVVMQLQEFNVVGPVANTLCSIRVGQAGTPTNAYLPNPIVIPFYGVGLSSGFGFQIVDTAANVVGCYGMLLYSKDISV